MNDYISKIKISSFRGIKDLEISDFGTVNVIAGVNNTGKTSLLEAIKVMTNPVNPSDLLITASTRVKLNNDNRIPAVKSLFMKNDITDEFEIKIDSMIEGYDYEIHLVGKDQINVTASGIERDVFVCKGTCSSFMLGRSNKYSCTFSENGRVMSKNNQSLFKTMYVATGIKLYSLCVRFLKDTILDLKKNELVSLLKSFDSQVTNIELINKDIYVENKSGLIPLYAYGTGFQKTVLISTLLLANPHSIVLFDEIDNAINISAFEEVFSWFVKTCRNLEIQAFVTTHSAEAIDAILNSVDTSSEDDIRMITLRVSSKTGASVAKVKSGREALNARELYKMELRV